ncbi:hypothetical protein TNCT_496521 [Trichonephila clavata]|uniref:Uncharacterized protein n=1 Tax=Trichonephila clavata TaxID=2740835 RepID=A0A8X6LYR9_TRICU|nr:hypothetical protein TNCT_496521 [Trichonephila clavata]
MKCISLFQPSPYDLKESRSSWSALQQSSAAACYPYDPSGLATCASYPDRKSLRNITKYSSRNANHNKNRQAAGNIEV